MNQHTPPPSPSSSPLKTRQTYIQEQAACLDLRKKGLSREQIAQKLGITSRQVKSRLASAHKAERLDPYILQKLKGQGITNLAGLHSGWLLEKDTTGSGSSLYFYLGPDQEKIDFAEAIKEVLTEIPLYPLVPAPAPNPLGKDFATWLFLADLHVGGDYGDPTLEYDFKYTVDDIVRRLPPAEKAVLFELGDILDANDHKGVTPKSGNPCDVKRDNHLANTRKAVDLMRYAAVRLLETHQEVEIHLVPGNHDPSAYVAVLLALEAHFADNPRVTVYVPNNWLEEIFRVVSWGQCACFPNHGDELKWAALKDVWTDQFPDAWAAAKAFRLIATAHFHHDRKQDLVGVVGEQFRTLHRPNRWAAGKGLLNRGSLSALTVHKERGEEHRTISNIKYTTLG